jgi:hypothetical protein
VQGPQADYWKPLGVYLQGRRGQLNPRWRKRSLFAASDQVTRAMISESVIRDIETGARKTYKPAMLANLERLYELPAGSILAYIETGDPEVLPPPPGAPLGVDTMIAAYWQFMERNPDLLDAIEDTIVANPDPAKRADDIRDWRGFRRGVERKGLESRRKAAQDTEDSNGDDGDPAASA